jgi:hypothetical protein
MIIILADDKMLVMLSEMVGKNEPRLKNTFINMDFVVEKL